MKTRLISFLGFCLPFLVLPASAAVFYVSLNNPNPSPPYAGWAPPPRTYRMRLMPSSDGDQIWVTNGIYQTGGRVMAGDSDQSRRLEQSCDGPKRQRPVGDNDSRRRRDQWHFGGALRVAHQPCGPDRVYSEMGRDTDGWRHLRLGKRRWNVVRFLECLCCQLRHHIQHGVGIWGRRLSGNA